MNKVKVDIVNTSNNQLPKYESDGASGMDIRAYISKAVLKDNPGVDYMTVAPRCTALVPTGLYVKLPEGYEFQIRPRSGLALKKNITISNSPGTIDSDYIGHIQIILHNGSDMPFIIANGDRICQMVLKEAPQAEWNVVTKLELTDRGEKGFGHTGTK